MDLLSGAGVFANIVSLIAQFADQRSERSAKNYEEFRAWLSDNRHEDIVKYLDQHSAALTGIKMFLSQNNEIVLNRLANIDRNLAALAAGTVELEGIALAIYPGAKLSRNALDFLREFEKSGSGRALESRTNDGRSILPFDETNSGPEFQCADWRFFEDDIATLVELGLLHIAHNKQGYRIFIYTRAASDLVRLLEPPSS
jgi:hypothetical protein